MALWREDNPDDSCVDVFVSDAQELKNSQELLLKEIADRFDFDKKIFAHNRKGEDANYKPSPRKCVMRRIKSTPIAKQGYNYFLERKNKKQHERLISEKFGELESAPDTVVSRIYACPKSQLLPALQKKYPRTPTSFFEHGLGDYIDVKQHLNGGSSFFCVLPEEFRNCVKKERIDLVGIHRAFAPERFPHHTLGKLAPGLQAFLEQHSSKKGSLVLMQPLENYSVKDDFWPAFMEAVWNRFGVEEQGFIILKPHPAQSPETTSFLEQWLTKQNLPVYVCREPASQSLNAEFLFAHMADQIGQIISPFSSSTFYIKKLYPDHELRAVYGIDLLLNEYAKRAARMYKKRWAHFRDNILPCFGQSAESV
jgi:hypothetical protein